MVDVEEILVFYLHVGLVVMVVVVMVEQMKVATTIRIENRRARKLIS